MIPWVREKFAERRARWLASRKREESGSNPGSGDKQCDNKSGLSDALDSQEASAVDSRHSVYVETSDCLHLRILTTRGVSVVVVVPPEATGSAVKKEALKQLALEAHPLPFYAANLDSVLHRYKLVRTRHRTMLHSHETVEKAGLVEGEELLLLTKRSSPTRAPPESVKGPTLAEVVAATKDLPATQPSPPAVNIYDMVLQTDLQYDIRKILISLAQSSAYVIGAGPFADRLIEILKQRLLNRRRHEASALESLLAMGFAPARVHQALKLKNNVYPAALEWLIENPSLSGQNSMEAPVSPPAVASFSLERGKFSSRRDKIEILLEIVRLHAQRDLPAPPETVTKIIEMGFPEAEVREALKRTQNNQAAACEWLVGSRSRSLTDLRDGLPTDSPVLQALLTSPQVQISLGNPKMFVAYLSMLDNYSSMSMWLSDTDTSGVLGHILRTYHEEKHIVAINQFSNLI
ncbi:ubiquitin-associated domain-containing protein 1 [Lutzomyia longipalpis]|uniref:ubiquitin-associated domain-containing protein 1 n=1 Tax=Lutzomyia longipalpis TaxID=7200 RepID=UPI0024835305|nr:ubiquitin-associated domain-containing protein 1 [Lutzomyia longipalpis]